LDLPFVLFVVAQNAWAFRFASQTLKNDRDFVLAAVAENGLALEFASEELKKDREVVLAAVAQRGLALEFASEDLKKDPFLTRVRNLNIVSSAAFLALKPLKSKLKQETNP